MVFSTFEKIIGPEAPYGYLLSRHMGSELQRQFLLRAFRLSPIRQKAIARLYSNGRIDQHLQVLRRRLKDGKEQMTRLLQERLGDTLQFVEPPGRRDDLAAFAAPGRHESGVSASAQAAGGRCPRRTVQPARLARATLALEPWLWQ